MSPDRPKLWVAAASVAVAGGCWAVLCLLLARAGHAPSATLLPLPATSYYRWQAAFVVPLLLAQWLATAAIAHRLARALGGASRFAAIASALGPALAAPLLVVFVIPDLVVFATAGFAALAILVRATGPLLLLTTVALVTIALRAATSLSRGRAAFAAVIAVLLPAAVAALLLR